MNASTLSAPAFGQADLSNCEREQIHLAGSIQPHGALLVVREDDLHVVQRSDNAVAFLGLGADPLGQPLASVVPDVDASIRPYLDDPLHRIPVAVRCRGVRDGDALDVLIHRPPDGSLVVELERAGPPVDAATDVRHALDTVVAAPGLRALAEDTARAVKSLLGYDRVMVYRFDDEGHGEVFSEAREEHLEPYLGNRYPASDIPQIARRLYERNRVRVLVDVEYTPVPLTPGRTPDTGRELDMSLCFLRSMSPIHLQYLKNMGVRATLVASLAVGGRLWGLIACHHCVPRAVQYELRAAVELLSETVATRIAALESFAQAHTELSVRRLEQRMIDAVSREGDWRTALFDGSDTVLEPVKASGAALLFEGQVHTAGEVPATPQLRDIARWLDERTPAPMHATASLGLDEPAFASLCPLASGLLAVPVSNVPGERLMWFRPERKRTVTWGGNPHKPVEVGNDPTELSPRRSFAQWHQLVEGTADAWTPADLAAARLIGASVSDVVQQFRSLRMLILEHQLGQVSEQVRDADQPAVIADATGRILLVNDRFDRLLGADGPALARLEDLPPLFREPQALRAQLLALLEEWRPWRGEVSLAHGAGEPRGLLLRADPVLASPERALGFVLMFTDLTERKEAEAARRRFQEGVVEHRAAIRASTHPGLGLRYRELLGTVVDNAQLAAMEITDCVDISHMPDMLEAVRSSVTRSAELLEHLSWYAEGPHGDAASGGEPDPETGAD